LPDILQKIRKHPRPCPQGSGGDYDSPPIPRWKEALFSSSLTCEPLGRAAMALLGCGSTAADGKPLTPAAPQGWHVTRL